MKVLFVCSGNSKEGITPIVKSQGESLRRNGIDLDYFTIRGKGVIGYLKNISKLKIFLKSNKFDIIHAHYSFCGWVSSLASNNIPVIVSLMGSDTYGDVNIKGKINFSSYFNIISTKLLQPFVSKIIVKSKNLEKYIYLKKKVEIIPNGVDYNKFILLENIKCKNKIGIDTNKMIILFLGDITNPRKNFNLLRSSLNLLNDNSIKLITPYPVSHEEIVFYLNAADVLVMTSYLEGSPNVIKEAMACNLPIVSTDVGDVKEVVGDTEGCYICSYDPKDVANKIKMAIDYGKRTNGRERIIELGLDSDTIAKKIIKVYEKVLGINDTKNDNLAKRDNNNTI